MPQKFNSAHDARGTELRETRGSAVAGLVARQRNPGMGQHLAYRLDVVPAARAAVMRVVQKGLDLVQRDLESGTVRGFDVGTQMVEERLDFAPMNVCRWRVLEDAAHQVSVLVTHDEAPSGLYATILCLSERRVRLGHRQAVVSPARDTETQHRSTGRAAKPGRWTQADCPGGYRLTYVVTPDI